MNDIPEFEIPYLLDDSSIYHFFDVNYDQWYSDFVNHWATHHLTHPCRSKEKNEGAGCLRAFILDGMQKVARPICTNKNKYIITDEFPDGIYIGCGNTPKSKSGLCESCRKTTILNDNETFLFTNDDNGIYDDPMTGCNVSREDRYEKECELFLKVLIISCLKFNISLTEIIKQKYIGLHLYIYSIKY
jgi:hypothetical protein